MLRLSAHRSAGVCRAGPGAAGSLRPPGPGPSPSLLPRSLISRSGWKRSNRCRLRRCGMGTAAVVPRAPHRARGRRGRTARGRHRAAVLCQRTSLKNSFPSFFFVFVFIFPFAPQTPIAGTPAAPPAPRLQPEGNRRTETRGLGLATRRRDARRFSIFRSLLGAFLCRSIK